MSSCRDRPVKLPGNSLGRNAARWLALSLTAVAMSGACSSSHRASSATTSSSTAPSTSSRASESTTLPRSPTTAPPRVPAFQPVSATFISARRGWVLEAVGEEPCEQRSCMYRIVATMDSGATWKTVAVLAHTPLGVAAGIRFADPSRGFVTGDTRLLATTDGGLHWRPLATPFARVQTLEVAAGTAYVVAWAQDVNAGLRLWWTPVDRIHWIMDPVAIPAGAGPVPNQQFAFAFGAGWLIDNDRVVVGAARLSSSHRWQSWVPPCRQVGGPAQLAASTRTDVVALCGEHIWAGPGPITTGIYFSHDGGRTFHRRTAPADGLVASPDSRSAVVATGVVLWRTTDEGVSWHVVGRPRARGGDSALQVGFTTPTQGFVIEQRGGMYITRDSGASWTRVRLP